MTVTDIFLTVCVVDNTTLTEEGELLLEAPACRRFVPFSSCAVIQYITPLSKQYARLVTRVRPHHLMSFSFALKWQY